MGVEVRDSWRTKWLHVTEQNVSSTTYCTLEPLG